MTAPKRIAAIGMALGAMTAATPATAGALGIDAAAGWSITFYSDGFEANPVAVAAIGEDGGGILPYRLRLVCAGGGLRAALYVPLATGDTVATAFQLDGDTRPVNFLRTPVAGLGHLYLAGAADSAAIMAPLGRDQAIAFKTPKHTGRFAPTGFRETRVIIESLCGL